MEAGNSVRRSLASRHVARCFPATEIFPAAFRGTRQPVTTTHSAKSQFSSAEAGRERATADKAFSSHRNIPSESFRQFPSLLPSSVSVPLGQRPTDRPTDRISTFIPYGDADGRDQDYSTLSRHSKTFLRKQNIEMVYWQRPREASGKFTRNAIGLIRAAERRTARI